MGLTTINTTKCVQCNYGTLDESDKSKIKIKCSANDREYNYGQRISCEHYTKKSIQINHKQNKGVNK